MKITYQNADQFYETPLRPRSGGSNVQIVGKSTLHGGEQVLLLDNGKWLAPDDFNAYYKAPYDDISTEALARALTDKYLKEINRIGNQVTDFKSLGDAATVIFETNGKAYQMKWRTNQPDQPDFFISFGEFEKIDPRHKYTNVRLTENIEGQRFNFFDLLNQPEFASASSPKDFADTFFDKYDFLGVVD